MSAGVVKVRAIPRCGCCDAPHTIAVCERCDEPMCDRHFVRARAFDGAVSYICAICAEVVAQDAGAPVTAGGVA